MPASLSFGALLSLVLSLAKVVESTELTAQGYAEVLAQGSPELTADFIETLLTQKLHGFVTSDKGLQTYASTAPGSFDLMQMQLSTQPWLCGGATGRFCENPLTAPLNEQGWASALHANATARASFVQRLAEERLGAKVTDKEQLQEWASGAPASWDLAYKQLKAADFLCGGDTFRKCSVSDADSGDGLNAHQRSAVSLGKFAFACLVLAALLLCVVSGFMWWEDRSNREAYADEMKKAKEQVQADMVSSASRQGTLTELESRPPSLRSAPAPQPQQVMFYQVPPMLPALARGQGSARVMSAGPASMQAPMISPASYSRAANEPWPV